MKPILDRLFEKRDSRVSGSPVELAYTAIEQSVAQSMDSLFGNQSSSGSDSDSSEDEVAAKKAVKKGKKKAKKDKKKKKKKKKGGSDSEDDDPFSTGGVHDYRMNQFAVNRRWRLLLARARPPLRTAALFAARAAFTRLLAPSDAQTPPPLSLWLPLTRGCCAGPLVQGWVGRGRRRPDLPS